MKTWCYDGNYIVPVTIQAWDCLGSPWEMTLVQTRVVGDRSVGATTSRSSLLLLMGLRAQLCWNLRSSKDCRCHGTPLKSIKVWNFTL
jgi:hypothetical protein